MSPAKSIDDPLNRMARVRVVLVRPHIAGNIGAVARLMENFGAGGLYLVQPAVDPLARESMQRSTHGEHRLHTARVVNTLADALEGVIYAIGATRRHLPTNQADDLSPPQMAHTLIGHIAGGEVALLFGAEDNGLSRDDLLACDAVVQIPAQPDYPTLNLSHAAAICLYEVFVAMCCTSPAAEPQPHRPEPAGKPQRRNSEPAGEPQRRSGEPADLALMSRLIAKLEHALLAIGYLRPEKPDHLMFPIRAILSRAALNRTKAQILIGLAQQIDEFARRGKA